MSTDSEPIDPGAQSVARLIDDIERHVASANNPRPGECLVCYVFRMLEHGCRADLVFVRRFQLVQAPRATNLMERLARLGAACCDCELFVNAYDLAPHVLPRAPVLDLHDLTRPRADLRTQLGLPDLEIQEALDLGIADDFDVDIADELVLELPLLLDAGDDADQLVILPPCAGVRRGSTQPCTHWRRRGRRGFRSR